MPRPNPSIGDEDESQGVARLQPPLPPVAFRAELNPTAAPKRRLQQPSSHRPGDTDRPTVPVHKGEEPPSLPSNAGLGGGSREPAEAGNPGAESEGNAKAPIDGGGIGLEVAEGLASLVHDSAASRVASRLGSHALLADSPPDQPLQPLTDSLGRLSDDPRSLRPSPTNEPVEVTPPTRPRLRRGWPALVAALGVLCAGAAVLFWPGSPEGEGAASPATPEQTRKQASGAEAESPRSTTPAESDSAEDEAAPNDRAAERAEPEVPSPPSSDQGKPVFIGAEKNAVELTEGSIPTDLPVDLVSKRVRSVLTRAERCHLGGRTTGTAFVHLTFGSRGRVRAVRIEGEPVAGSAVAKCVIAHARAVVLPEFDGADFTIRAKITLL